MRIQPLYFCEAIRESCLLVLLMALFSFSCTPEVDSNSGFIDSYFGSGSSYENSGIPNSSENNSDPEVFPTATPTSVPAAPNRSPDISAQEDLSRYYGSPVNLDFNDSGNDTDVDLDAITYTCVVDSAVSCAALGVAFGTSDGSFNWTSSYSHIGVHNFTISGSDGSLSDEEAFRVTVSAPPRLTQISTGINHSCGLTNLGVAYCWGLANDGRLGNGATSGDVTSPVLVDQSELVSGESFIQLSLGDQFSCGLTNTGKSFCWGSDSSGQLGDGVGNIGQLIPIAVDMSNLPSGESFIQISLGEDHACGLSNSGVPYCWGAGAFGQLGNGATATQHIATAVDMSNLTSGETFTQLSLGLNHSCALTNSGKVFCWGRDHLGQIGDGAPDTNQNIPVAIDMSGLASGVSFTQIVSGAFHSCGLTNSGTAYCWGQNFSGELGLGAIVGHQNAPIAVDMSLLPSGETFKNLANSFGNQHSCAITNSGNTYCWGSDDQGQLGNGSGSSSIVRPTLIDTSLFPTGEKFLQLALANNHGCGLSNSGVPYCWGSDDNGQVGNGAVVGDQASPVVVDMTNVTSVSRYMNLTSGQRHTCGFSERGTAVCWGRGHSGQLGNSAVVGNQLTPIAVDTTNLTSGESFIQTDLGTDHSCGLSSSNRAFCWGSDGSG